MRSVWKKKDEANYKLLAGMEIFSGKLIKVHNQILTQITNEFLTGDATCCPTGIGEVSLKLVGSEIISKRIKETVNNIVKKEKDIGNDIIKQIDSSLITTYDKKLLRQKYRNKEFDFYGEVSDIKDLREIVLMINLSNYANIHFVHDIPIKEIRKKTKVLIRGTITSFGTGIIFKHTIVDAKLLNMKGKL